MKTIKLIEKSHMKSLFILILHGDYVLILIVYSWLCTAGAIGGRCDVTQYSRGSTVQNQDNNNFRKARQMQSGLNQGVGYEAVVTGQT